MADLKNIFKDASKTAGTIAGDALSKNLQDATNESINGMDLFRWKISTPIIQNGTFDAQKGNLFEYIEAAKFNADAAKKGLTARAIVTDVTDPTAAADILIKEDGLIKKEIQAKFVKSSKDGRDNSAAKSVYDQAGGQKGHWGKYNGMDRLIRKQDDYNADGSLLNEAKKISSERASTNSIYSKHYEDVSEKLTDETYYKDATSGGTTFEEVEEAYNKPKEYSKIFEKNALKQEMKCTAANMAKASFVTTGLVSGITNMMEVFKDNKELTKAICDVGTDAIKGAARGGATGVVSTAIRFEGVKTGSALLSDSTAATVMAGGIIDGGVALYSYARGEIDETELKEQLIDTTAKAVSTVYFTKAVEAIMGATVNPILPMVVYTTASYVVSCTREIIKNAKLNAEEYERMASILIESTKEMEDYHEKFKLHVKDCEERQRKMFDQFIESFEYNIETGYNYDESVYAIVKFANEAGIMLQHTDFDDFAKSMKSKDVFKLKV